MGYEAQNTFIASLRALSSAIKRNWGEADAAEFNTLLTSVQNLRNKNQDSAAVQVAGLLLDLVARLKLKKKDKEDVLPHVRPLIEHLRTDIKRHLESQKLALVVRNPQNSLQVPNPSNGLRNRLPVRMVRGGVVGGSAAALGTLVALVVLGTPVTLPAVGIAAIAGTVAGAVRAIFDRIWR
jgi:hypothetical protein